MSAHLHDIAATIVGLLITLPSAYLAFLAAVSLLPRRARPRVGPSADRETFAILVPAHDEERVIARTLASLAGLEYPRDRFSVHVVADNCSSWRFVLGPLLPPRETGGLRMRMSLDGRAVQETDSNSISGNPIESLVQLVGMLGRPLPANSIVLAGAATVAEPLRAGVVISLEVESLGEVRVRAI